MQHVNLVLTGLILGFAPQTILGEEVHDETNTRDVLQKRLTPFELWNRERNAHACIMSIVFIVLFPLGAISAHLPIERIPYINNTYLKKKIMAIHAPIQILGLVLMIIGMVFGIKIGQFTGYLSNPVQAHVVIGLLVVCTIIIFQPIMGILQHQYFKRTGGKGKFAYLHRWIGRGAIILGMINSGLGFQLAATNVIVPTSSYIRSYVILGILVSIWFGFIIYDEFKLRQSRTVTTTRRKIAA